MFLAMGIDRLTAGGTGLWLPILGILGAVSCRFGIVSWARISVRRAGFLVQYDLRDKFYAHLQRMGPTFFNQFAIGDLMTRAIADIQLVRQLISHGTIMVVIFVFATVVGFSCMAYMSPALTLFVLPPLPFLFIYTWRTSLKLGRASRAVQERMSDMGSHVQENISGVRTIQAMVQEENEIKRFDAHNQAYTNAFYGHARIQSLMQVVMASFAAVSIVTILGYGGHLVMTNELSYGEFTAFFGYVNMIVQPFRVAGFTITLLQRAAVASRRLFKVFDYQPEIEDSPKPNVPTRVAGALEVKSLSFTYGDADSAVLKNISLHVEVGQMITIMGRVGSGKTTFLKQFVRILNTPRQTIFLDGVDICDYSLKQLRQYITFVPQEAFLFGEPIRSNITYDKPRRAIEEIWDAAEIASLDSTIHQMERKMDTMVGERGVTLSGGQKQRTTVARGAIRDAPVLILDDCFASVDTETEESILRELKQLRQNQTTILVSHRVSTAQHSDLIVILDQGGIVERGAHEYLLEHGGFYAELERIQREGAHDLDYELAQVRAEAP